METKALNNDNVEIAFPKYEQTYDKYIPKGTGENTIKYLSKSIDAISDWFKQYEVETLELWISGIMETEGITKLVVSARGEGGLKVILRPKSLAQTTNH